MIRPSTLIALLIALFLVFPAPLRADEGEQEQSEAAKLFREAWWAETGSGALDKAVEGYTKAAAAKGSDTIRARALYRRAVVLQRMGKTEDAVRQLAALAERFPAESTLLAQAKQRLDEWTAEDLRTSFSDWYRRYQYSAEFQAKIVDLVLKLGGADQGASNAARRELLTIGEPALNALREHTRSANLQLRYIAIDLIMELGELPPPGVLWKSQWHREADFWDLLADADAAERAAYAQAAAERKDDYRSAWIVAFLAGPDAVIDVVAKETKDTQYVTRALLGHILRREPEPAIYARLRAIAKDEDVHSAIRKYIADKLLSTWIYSHSGNKADPTGLTADELVEWVAHEPLREVILPHMRGGHVPLPNAWRAVAKVSLALPPRSREQTRVLAALFGQLRLAAQDADLETAVQAVTRQLEVQPAHNVDAYPLGEGGTLAGDGSVPRAVLAAAIGRATGKYVGGAPQGAWWQRLRGREGVFDAVVGWLDGAADAEVRKAAASIVAYEIRDDVGRLTGPLADPARRAELRDRLFQALRSNAELTRLDWDAEDLTRLVETARTWDGYSESRTTSATAGPRGSSSTQVHSHFARSETQVLITLLHHERTRDLFFDAAFAAPERFPSSFWSLLGTNWPAKGENQALALGLLRSRWKGWTVEQRPIGFKLFLSPYFLKRDENVVGFLREVLAERDLDAGTRYQLLGKLPSLTLDDLRAMYDFGDREQRSQAERLMGHVPEITLADVRSMYDFEDPEEVDRATQHLHRLPVSEEVYDAFRLALRPDGGAAIVMYERFKAGPASRAEDLLQRLLAHENKALHGRLRSLLQNRDTVEDLPVWMAMLTHESAWLRMEAAKALGRLYNQAAIKALAKAVDDPDPNVRDAVLASLERIEKTEKQKERWRKYAEGK